MPTPSKPKKIKFRCADGSIIDRVVHERDLVEEIDTAPILVRRRRATFLNGVQYIDYQLKNR